MKKALTMFVFWVMCFVLFNTSLLWAGQEGWKEISAPQVKGMIENGNVVVIHVLSEIEYNMQHITGSINIPIIKVKTTEKLPKDKETPLVFYCMGKR